MATYLLWIAIIFLWLVNGFSIWNLRKIRNLNRRVNETLRQSEALRDELIQRAAILEEAQRGSLN